jgi:hypothetical protein
MPVFGRRGEVRRINDLPLPAHGGNTPRAPIGIEQASILRGDGACRLNHVDLEHLG